MKYTKQQRAAIANTLRASKRHLTRTYGDGDDYPVGKSPYICVAIRLAHVDAEGHRLTTRLIETMITTSNDGANLPSFGRWLCAQSESISQAVLNDIQYNEGRKLQQHRLDWVNQLIAEFEQE